MATTNTAFDVFKEDFLKTKKEEKLTTGLLATHQLVFDDFPARSVGQRKRFNKDEQADRLLKKWADNHILTLRTQISDEMIFN
jgi:hypothetical protein